MRSRLVLFDIDGTLVDVRGAGLGALRRAAADLHGDGCPELDLRGATDRGLARDILGAYGVEPSEEALCCFFDAYLAHLEASLGRDDFDGEVLPGVRELLDSLRAAGATLGLLTGNIAAGAAAKMARFGLSAYFRFGAYGDDHHDRNELGPIAMRRALEAHGRMFTAAETVVVGDTPRDVDCGKALGALTLCVATGAFGADELRAAGADVVVESFADRGAVLTAFGGRSHNAR